MSNINKKILKHLLISICLILGIVFISIPIAINKTESVYPYLTWLMRLSVGYFFITLILLIFKTKSNIIKTVSKTKKDKEMQKDRKVVKETNKDINIIKHEIKDEEKKLHIESNKAKKKFTYKTETDRLYEEAVKYFGKAYVKNRFKNEVVEEYLKETGSI